jgi:hypothetical protein
LRPAVDLLSDEVFWSRQCDGLALFLSPNWHRQLRLPVKFEEIRVVADRFHVKPLVPLISSDHRFFLLTISLDQVHLYQGDRYLLECIDSDALPKDMDQALRFDDPERTLQYHTQTNSTIAPVSRRPAYHGHGVSTENAKKERVFRFLQIVERGVFNAIGDQTAPLLLAGVEYIQAIYREANTYGHLVDKGITGSPGRIPKDELHEQALAIAESIFLQRREALASRYHSLLEHGQASAHLAEVVAAAHRGKVEALFVAKGKEVWGHFNPKTYEIHLHDVPNLESEDLLDLAIVQTFIHRGDAFAVPQQEVPGGGRVAAILRY